MLPKLPLAKRHFELSVLKNEFSCQHEQELALATEERRRDEEAAKNQESLVKTKNQMKSIEVANSIN